MPERAAGANPSQQFQARDTGDLQINNEVQRRVFGGRHSAQVVDGFLAIARYRKFAINAGGSERSLKQYDISFVVFDNKESALLRSGLEILRRVSHGWRTPAAVFPELF